MKKMRLRAVIAFVVLLSGAITGCSGIGGGNRITVNEAVHSAFYAPFYVAIEKGYFKDEGLKLNVVIGSGADNTKRALLEEECDIGLLGTEVSINVYNEGTSDFLVNFAQLTQRAGDILVSRVVNEEFSWKNLKGKTVIAGKAGGMPQMVFEYILKKQGVDPKKDLTMIQDVETELVSQSFVAGQGDYVILFEPDATIAELEGKGKVVASLGMVSGKVPYTAFAAKKSFIQKNPVLIQSFTNAIQKGLDYVVSHTPEETAKVIESQFPDTDRDALVLILQGYYEQDTWKGNLVFEEGSYTLLMDLMEDSGELLKHVPYEEIVASEYAEKALKLGDKIEN